jgi:hypoxanthine phosphoribosyltransferase
MVPVSFKEIAERLKKTKLPETDLVLGIGTGGVVAASLVAFQLGCELQIITVNFRDEKNSPQHDSPVFINIPDNLDLTGKKVLLVDDVSVSGKTLQAVISKFPGQNIKTFTLKGRADYVLFLEISDCVKWPWKG